MNRKGRNYLGRIFGRRRNTDGCTPTPGIKREPLQSGLGGGGGGGITFCARRAAQVREKRTGNPTAGIKTQGKLCGRRFV